MVRTKRDANQITRYEHDEKSNAKRVIFANTEISIELDHADGDSVTAHPAKLSVTAEGVDAEDDGKIIIPAIDCSSIKTINIAVNGSGTLAIEISLSDTHDHWITLGNSTGQYDLCARRIRVKSTNVLGDVHLAGRS